MLEWLSKPFLHSGRWSRRALLRAGAIGVGGLMRSHLLWAASAPLARQPLPIYFSQRRVIAT